ncbi:MAG: efflux RND transporter periplasmic adaptor subunit, partial [Burkholderiales bacterium]|nr:efflux RND transporter periplasmic adaptor subunit [Burkholderiales bacterium]
AVGESFDGVVEAVRQTVVAAQVAGAVVELDVKVGDRVKAGQQLMRIDARGADQDAAASQAQVQAARAAQKLASQDYARQQQLFQKNYISQAALERARSAYDASQAQVAAQLAQAGAARTQTGLHVVRAPYAGVVAEVPVALGDMALPGRALVTLFDPSALRVTAALPQSLQARIEADLQGGLQGGPALRVELPGLPAASQWPVPVRVQVLPLVDAATHTLQLRADLEPGLAGVAPGQFARVWVAGGAGAEAAASITVPLASVVRRAEMVGLYVLDSAGRPLLRQVRLGRVLGDRVEVLAGLAAGERVAADPQAAARLR